MAKIFGANFNAINVLGLLILCAVLFMGFWLIVDHFVPEKPSSGVTLEEIRSMNQSRYDYEDSVNQANNAKLMDSIRFLTTINQINDSVLFFFYNQQSKIYENNIRNIDRASDNELMRQWTKRYR